MLSNGGHPTLLAEAGTLVELAVLCLQVPSKLESRGSSDNDDIVVPVFNVQNRYQFIQSL